MTRQFYVFPASRAQQRLYFVQKLLDADPASAPTYSIPLFYEVRGPLDVAALDAAVRDVVARHEALRTHFAIEDDALVQVIDPDPVVAVEVVDGSPDAGTEGRAEGGTDVDAWRAAEAARPFDLDRGPLFRAAVLRRGPDDHVLLLSMHHVVTDGWSLDVLLRDLRTAYRARVDGSAPQFGDEPLQYADFSAWQDEWLDGSAAAEQLAHWTTALRGELPVLRLDAARVRRGPGRLGAREVPSTAGAGHLFPLPADAVEAMRALCRAHDRTLFAGMLAVFAELLRRHTGVDDVLVGTPVANRTRHEFEDTVGLFVNTIVVRCDVSGEPTFRELLDRVGRAAVDAYGRQELPFEQVVHALNPRRAAGHDPLFQVLFGLHPAPADTWDLPGLVVTQLENRVTTAKFELSLDVIDDASHPAAVFQHRTGLLDHGGEHGDDPAATTPARLADRYRRLLAAAVAEPDRPVATLPMLAPDERAALLPAPARPSTGPGGATGRCVHELVAEHAARRPDAIAVTCDGEHVTYGELVARAGRLARRLRAAGVGPDVLVGLCAERSIDLVTGVLGIALAGGAHVPLDPAYPAARLDFLVRDTGVRHVVAQRALAGRVPAPGATVVLVDDHAAAGGDLGGDLGGDHGPGVGSDGGSEVGPAGLDHLAYVIHTSGSTGTPKGTLVTHRNVARLLTATAPWFGFGEDDVWTLFHSSAFDFSVWELWGALTTGGRLVVVPHDVSRQPGRFHRLLRDERVTVLNQTPSAFRQLVDADTAWHDHDATGRDAARDGAGGLALRHVVFGGEALDPATLRPWVRRHGDERPRLVNMYGITEVTVHATYQRVRAGDVERGGASVVGVPLPDLAALVLDATGEPVPAGAPGELVLAGAGVARGYLGRPDLTAARFTSHPADPACPAYRTGDLVRRLADGTLEYLGRIDDQVKIRGFRVEPGEIEAALVRLPDVRDAAVLAVRDPAAGPVADSAGDPTAGPAGAAGERRLVGHVVGPPTLDATTLRESLRRTLPDHLVPAVFVVHDRFPLTHNGKTDRAALAAIDVRGLGADTTDTAAVGDTAGRDAGAGDLGGTAGRRHGAHAGARLAPAGPFAEPRTVVERALAAVWADVLGVARVGVDDNYFALGGDSIRSIRLIAAAERAGVRFTAPDLLRHQTIRELAPLVTTDAVAGPASTEAFALLDPADRALVPDGVEDAYPLTRLQAGMLFHSEASGQRIYHNVASYLVSGAWSERAWRAAVEAVIARHEILRTSFDVGTYREPAQLVHKAVDPPVTVADLRALTPAEQAADADRRFAAERATGFAVGTAPMFRVRLDRLADDACRLWIAEHHAILDGWSERALFGELLRRYRDELTAERAGSAAPRPEPPPAVRFREFVELELAALADDASRRFWLDALDGSTLAELPRWRPPRGEPDMRTTTVDLDPATSDAVLRSARDLAVSPRAVVLAAHVRVMAVLAGSTDVVTGVVLHGRPETAGGDEVLGAFLNTVPLRVRLDGGTWAGLVRAVADADLAAQPHRRYPMSQIRRDVGRPLFETFVNYTRFGDAAAPDGQSDARDAGGVDGTGGPADDGGVRVVDERGVASTDFPFGAEFSLLDEPPPASPASPPPPPAPGSPGSPGSSADGRTADEGAGGRRPRLGLRLRFDAARLDAEQIERVGGWYRAALTALAADPGGRHDVDLLSDAEHALADAVNATEHVHDAPHVLTELVARQRARTPDAIACVADGGSPHGPAGESLTHAELGERADALARRLARHGAGRGAFVGVCLPRSLDLVVALLAVLRTGAAYVPLDPDDPPDRVAGLVAEAGLSLVLGRADTRDRLGPLDGVTLLDPADADDGLAAPGGTDAPPWPVVTPADAAYLIFTSGSTGTPKGVVVSHRAIANRLLWMQRAYGLRAGEAVLQKTPHTFDVSVWEFFWPLTTGGRLVLARPGDHRDPARLDDVIRRHDVTTAHFVPSMLDAFLEHADLREPVPLRRVICSGEALPTSLARRCSALLPDAELHNLYGPTEAAVDVTAWHVDPADDGGDGTADGDTAPIGLPVDNTTVHVLDPFGHPSPVGVAGELHLGGVQLADGYHRRPELTAERFVTWTGRDGVPRRLYRTGDLARRRPDGALVFAGRVDDQVKIRGFRVEPGEIEAALRRHDAVADAAVTWHADRLTAHVVPAREPVEPAELARFLGTLLPDHLVPSAWAFRDALPLSRNGKLDRAALRRAAPGAAVRPDPTPPRDADEARLAALVESVLGDGPVGVHDDFFAIGGHSLSALRLAALAGVPVSAVLRARTVAGLAEHVRRAATAVGSGVAAGPDADVLVPLRDGAGAPLFLVHPAGGTVFCYRALAEALPPGRPVHGLAAPAALAEPGGAAVTVEALADRHLPVITRAAPAGPWHLAGWSFGGLVAFELARRLRERGPVTLAMIDTAWPHPAPPAADVAAAFAEDVRRTAGGVAAGGVAAGGAAADTVLARQAAVFAAHVAAQAGYAPRPYDGPAVVVRGTARRGPDPWCGVLAGPHSTHDLDADHYALMREPHVDGIARLVARALADADRAAGGDHDA